MTGRLLVTSSTVHTTRRGARLAVPLGLAAALLLTACGGGDGSATPSPTGSADASVLPSRTDSLASPTRSPTRRESADATPSATVTVTESPEGSASATAGEPTESPAASSEGQEASGGGIPAWAWVLLVAGALAAVLAILLRRSRRRRSWQADLSAAEEEVAWFAGELLPQLQRAASPDEVAGGWRVATRRVTSIEDRLDCTM